MAKISKHYRVDEPRLWGHRLSPDPRFAASIQHERGHGMTGLSLREQLLAAGLGNKKQAKHAEQEQQRQQEQRRHEQRQQPKKVRAEPPPPTPAQLAQAAKAARDKELNRKRQEQVELRAKEAEIKQLIGQHKLPRIEAEDCEYYNFVHGKKIRRIAVDAQRREQIVAGTIFVVRYHGQSAVVPAEIAAKIRERDARAVVSHSADTPTGPAEADDPYKDFVVPDDLTW
jgi:uncharacterized protein YaiL (DUF2058 family)